MPTQLDEYKQAKTLKEVILNFDPDWPLPPTCPFIVDLPVDPLNMVNQRLEPLRRRGRIVNLFFTGHRGSGKSTQIQRLIYQLRNDQHIIPFYFDARKELDPSSLDYTDLIFSIARTSIETFESQYEEIKKNASWKELKKRFLDWGTTTIRETIDKQAAGGEIDAGLSYFFLKVQGFLKRSHEKATTVRKEIESGIDELYTILNDAILEIEQYCNRKVFFIMDGLDRPTMELAAKLFTVYRDKLLQPACSLLYVIGVSLPYVAYMGDMAQNTCRICNIPIFKQPGNVYDLNMDDNAFGIFKKVIEKRMLLSLINEEALHETARVSAGVIYQMITTIQKAANIALERNSRIIELEDVKRVRSERRYFFWQQINHVQDFGDSEGVFKLCREIAESRNKLPAASNLIGIMLHASMIIEYPNDPIFLGLDPAMSDLLEESHATNRNK